MTDPDELAARFEEHRVRLHHLAYRMLGSDAEADDVVQETWLRLARTGDDDIDNLGGWLTTTASRICLNVLRSRSTRAETEYVEEMPMPVVRSAAPVGDPEASAQLSDAVETALLLVLDRLSPAERIAFVLHDTFDVPFEQVGELLERSPEAARQLASRARRRVRADGPGAEASSTSRGRRLVDAFFDAASHGDFDALVSLLAPDVMLRADGVASATVIVRGAAEVAGRALMFANPGAVLRPVLVNGDPGVVVTVDGVATTMMAFRLGGERIVAIDTYAGARLEGIRLPS